MKVTKKNFVLFMAIASICVSAIGVTTSCKMNADTARRGGSEMGGGNKDYLIGW